MDLISVPQDDRDSSWEEKFLKEFSTAKLTLISPDPKQGPDGWPYLFAEIAPDGGESVADVVSWLATRGIGLVVNPTKIAPDYVFSYGMIWNFRERGQFLSPAPERKSGEFRLSPGQELLAGAPSEAFLPHYARSILKQFFLDQGVMAPKVLMASQDHVNYDLCFSIESLKSPPTREHQGIAEAISWFLPAHYSVALVSESALPGFTLL